MQRIGDGQVEIAAIDPAEPVGVIGNPALSEIAAEVGLQLRKAVAAV